MSDAKKLGAVIGAVEGGMPEMLRADPDVQFDLALKNARLCTVLSYVNDRIKRIHILAGLDEPIREQCAMAKDAIDAALAKENDDGR